MDIIKEYNEKNLILKVSGRIDTITSKDIQKVIEDEHGNYDELTLDFKELDYISSAGLRLLVMTQKKLKKEDIPFSIKNIKDGVFEIFRMSGLNKVLNIE